MKKITKNVYRIISSKKFFYIIIGFFIIQAVWFAVCTQYPMAFDENYHFGIIQIYSHQLTPFVTSMPDNSGAFGDITRYDSYLYHYLMSFPYRIIDAFIHQEVTQIIILRFINIGLFVGGLLIYRRLFRRIGLSEGIINFSTTMLVLIPIVPFLAATINYDNLVFLSVPILVGLTLECSNEITKNNRLPAKSLLLFLTVGGLASLIKYAFLPIFIATFLYLLIIFIKKPSKSILLSTFISSFIALKRWFQIILVLGVLVSGGLVLERYGLNLVRYHSLEPDCAQVQPLSHCMQYGPWGRNYRIATDVALNNPTPYPPIESFVSTWFEGMMERLYFAINFDYFNLPPLPIPIFVATYVGLGGLILCLVFWKSIVKIDRRLILFALVIAVYVGAVFYANFAMYLRYRTALALNGRYLIMIFPLLFVWLGLGYRQLFNLLLKKYSQFFIAIISIIALLLMTQGGGFLTHLIRSKPNWYWQNQTIIDYNQKLKETISPFIIGS